MGVVTRTWCQDYISIAMMRVKFFLALTALAAGRPQPAADDPLLKGLHELNLGDGAEVLLVPDTELQGAASEAFVYFSPLDNSLGEGFGDGLSEAVGDAVDVSAHLTDTELEPSASYDHGYGYGGHHHQADDYHGGHHSEAHHHQPHTQSQSYSHSKHHSSSEDHDHYHHQHHNHHHSGHHHHHTHEHNNHHKEHNHHHTNICDSSLPNSCFRSGNSLGRVSMIDGCHVLRAASSGALRSWDPFRAAT